MSSHLMDRLYLEREEGARRPLGGYRRSPRRNRFEIGDIDVRWSKSRRRSVACCRKVMRSTIVADFYRRSELVAAVKIGEYHLCHISNADFIDVMDGEGGYERELALVMCDAWPDPLDRKLLGPLLDFSFAWISENVAERKLLTHVADVLIGQTCPYYSLLLVKAYPSGDEEQDG